MVNWRLLDCSSLGAKEWVFGSGAQLRFLDVEFEFDDVTVLHDVSFSFGTEFAGGFDGLFGAVFFKVVVVADLSSNKATFKVGMDGASGFGCSGAFFDGPGATLFFASREE